MKKLLLLAAAGAILLAACGSSGAPLASVNETEFTRSDVEGLVLDSSEEVTDSDVAQYLGVLIQWEATEQRAEEELGFIASDEAIDTSVADLVAQAGPGVTLEDYLASINASEDAIRRFATQVLIQEALSEHFSSTSEGLSDAEIESEILANPRNWTNVCAAHILVATEEEAADVVERLDGGEDFAAVAAELSLDPGSGANGGDLGCSSPAQYVEPFADATMTADLGVVTEPVQSDFGFHVILVNERTTASVEDARAFLQQTIISEALDAWFADAVANAVISVDPEFGEWVLDPAPQVLLTN